MKPLAALQADWPQLSRLLDEALAVAPPERARWLDALPPHAAGLRQTLAELLAAHAGAETGDFLHTLPRVEAGVAREPAAGDTVAGWRLLRLLGQGGMGAVWLAERAERSAGDFQRQVALKLPRTAWGDALTRRMARERDIQATLTHPRIARLYDAGVDAHGRPWLAMEYVPGRPIDQVADARGLDVPARVRLLLQLCEAVAYLHGRLVIHRDLKPSNILVGDDGELRLLDFGIAKLLQGDGADHGAAAATGITRDAGRVMTPEYASPEQVLGQPLGVTSDVYSLGVVAFELLAGSAPYALKRGSAAELEEAIAAADVPPASRVAPTAALKRALRGDLDAILAKALKKAPAERYASVEQLAADLRRHLAREPVLAQPDSLGYRAARFASRNRLQLASAGVVALALLVGTGVALWQAREAREQASLARSEAATAKAVQGFIESVFNTNSGDQADPARARDATARQLLDRGAERIETELASAPAARLRLYTTLAEMYDHMALAEPALAYRRKRVALADTLHASGSSERVIARAALASQLLSGDRGDLAEEALALLTSADAALLAAGNRDPLARYHVDLNLGSLYWRTDPPKALPLARRALAAARQQPPSADLVIALQLVGDVALQTGDKAEARAALAEAVALVEANPALGRSALAQLHAALGDAQNALGEPDAARASYERALHSAMAPMPSRHVVAFKLANFHYRNGFFAESLAAINDSAAWARRPEAPALIGELAALIVSAPGRALIAYGRVQEGLAVIDHSIAMLAGGQDQAPRLGPLLAMRGDALTALGRYAEAEAALAQAHTLIGDGRTGQAHLVRPARRRLWLATGRADEALREFSAGPPPAASADPLAAPRRLAESATLEWAAGHADAARTQSEDALRQLAALPARAFAREAEAQAAWVLGQVLLSRGTAAEALAPLQRAEALRRAIHDPARSLALADVLLTLAQCQQALGDTAAARRVVAEARRIHASHASVGEHHRAALRRLAL